ncbi:putative choline transporter [Aspergillus brunneoviolaceus CBS 621.78]|uniref:Choline transporter n=1 Tax=Aspergillus brunneoviolaceus CBS 621.78 TaxID=1450534 RepID=A0ACD1FUA2_9EURO|nr:putative choline transporter [Aspergillus brunneoviolaceus CBS 621.78]RAH40588.1 putative choline transporter [Aspergillus brunneoviolaceus CBS 621.78]
MEPSKTTKQESVRIGGMVEQGCVEGLVIGPAGTRKMTPLQIISASWIICDSWAGVSATVALAIAQGGPVTMVYGLILMFLLVGACTLTLAELSSVYPTAGGQYHWTSILAPGCISRGLSYACGMANMFAWIAICTGIAIIPSQLILGIVLFYNPGFNAQPWHYFILYQVINVLVLFYCTALLKKSLWIHDACFFITLASFFVIVIVCLARTAPNFQPNVHVWANFLNDSGWTSGGVAFLTDAARVVPRALLSTLVIGFGTSFAFLVTMLYCTDDLKAVVASATGVPIYEVWYQATHSKAAATTFIILLSLAAAFALIGAQETAARLTWSLARDNTLYGSSQIKKMHPSLDVPAWALVFNFSVMFIIGCIYLGSSSAFNAFIATGLVLQHVSYAIPAALLLLRRRGSTWLPANRPFRLPGPVGWTVNFVTVGFTLLALVFYSFPTARPVTGSNMNYTAAVLGCMAIVALGNWVFYARRWYCGPRLHGLD